MPYTVAPFGFVASPTGNTRFQEFRSHTPTSRSLASTRMFGLWVPAECFRKGTCIVVEGMSTTGSPRLQLSLGGPGTGNQLGATLLNPAVTGAATAPFRAEWSQEGDGYVTTWRTNIWVSGVAGTSVTSAVMFIQPLNFVDIATSGTNTIDYARMTFYPAGPQVTARYQEIVT